MREVLKFGRALDVLRVACVTQRRVYLTQAPPPIGLTPASSFYRWEGGIQEVEMPQEGNSVCLLSGDGGLQAFTAPADRSPTAVVTQITAGVQGISDT